MNEQEMAYELSIVLAIAHKLSDFVLDNETRMAEFAAENEVIGTPEDIRHDLDQAHDFFSAAALTTAAVSMVGVSVTVINPDDYGYGRNWQCQSQE